MVEDLKLSIDRTQGEGPSQDFVDRLRAQIVAESTSLALISADEKLDETRPWQQPRKPWKLLTVAAAVVVTVTGAIVATKGTTNFRTTTAEPTTLDVDAVLLTDEFSNIGNGTYRVEAAGTPFTFSIDEPKFAAVNSEGRLAITHSGSQGSPGDRVLSFQRLSVLSDPTAPATSPKDLDNGNGWPAEDFSGWLDNASDQIIVSNRHKTTIGGLEATMADIEVSESACPPGADFCILLGANHSVYDSGLQAGGLYRIWVVDQEDEHPLVVMAAIDRESDIDWFDTAEAIVASLAFGDIKPNPVLAGAGPTTLPFLGGIRVNLPEGSYAVTEPQGTGRIPLKNWMAGTEFVANPGGRSLQTVDELTAHLRVAGAELTEIEGTAVSGLNARVFDLHRPSTEPSNLAPDGNSEWTLPPRGRVWLVEHPDRGLVAITAAVYKNIDIVLPIVIDQAEQVIASLEFVESG